MKRKTYMRLESGSKALLIIILVVSIIAGGAVGTLYFVHDNQTAKELATMQESGLVKLVSISDGRNVNVAVRGAATPKHTFVTISGLNFPDFGVYMDYITAPLQNENRLVIVDRLGTGFSDDVDAKANRTASVIVEEYRKALQKSMVDGPYILLAHEIGAAYATHWQNTYPDEIEGIIYIDPNPIDKGYAGLKPDDKATLLSLGCKFGLQRLMYDDLYTPEAVRVPSDYVVAASYFNYHSVYTTGYLSELNNAEKSIAQTLDVVQNTNIPKMYINSSYAFETKEEALEYVDYVNAQARSVGQDKVYNNAEGAAEKLVALSDTMTAKINSYVQALGNCHLVKMPGGPDVYQQHHGVLESAIIDFVDYLDGNVSSLQSRYVDKILDEWQKKQEQEALEQQITETEASLDEAENETTES